MKTTVILDKLKPSTERKSARQTFQVSSRDTLSLRCEDVPEPKLIQLNRI